MRVNVNSNYFHPVTALFLMSLCDLSYKSEAEIHKKLDASMEGHRFFSIQETDTQGIICWEKDYMTLIYRGTELFNIRDWMTDFKGVARMETNKISPYGVIYPKVGYHPEMFKAWASAQQTIESIIVRNNLCNKKVYIAGHSLGGGLTNIASAMPEAISYTFGAPRSVDREFARQINKNSIIYRIVNDRDIVTRIPPQWLGYSHVGNLYYIQDNGMMVRDINRNKWATFWDRIITIEDFTDHRTSIYIRLLLNNCLGKLADDAML